jgi:hypothetical protein
MLKVLFFIICALFFFGAMVQSFETRDWFGAATFGITAGLSASAAYTSIKK